MAGIIKWGRFACDISMPRSRSGLSFRLSGGASRSPCEHDITGNMGRAIGRIPLRGQNEMAKRVELGAREIVASIVNCGVPVTIEHLRGFGPERAALRRCVVTQRVNGGDVNRQRLTRAKGDAHATERKVG